LTFYGATAPGADTGTTETLVRNGRVIVVAVGSFLATVSIPVAVFVGAVERVVGIEGWRVVVTGMAGDEQRVNKKDGDIPMPGNTEPVCEVSSQKHGRFSSHGAAKGGVRILHNPTPVFVDWL
jgi:hypothetical protein